MIKVFGSALVSTVVSVVVVARLGVACTTCRGTKHKRPLCALGRNIALGGLDKFSSPTNCKFRQTRLETNSTKVGVHPGRIHVARQTSMVGVS
eukprot:scaffold21095_cov92-Amphora_coffeaeformis.AAC.1